MRPRSLRLRLAAAGAAAVLLAMAAAAVGLWALFASHVERRAEAELAVHLDQLAAGIERDADGALAVPRPLADPRFARPLSGLYWQAEAGGRVLRSRSLWDGALALPRDLLADGAPHLHELPGPRGERLMVLERRVRLPARLGGADARIAVGMDRAQLDAAAADFLADLAPALGLMAVLLTLAGWVQLAVGLRPLGRVEARVAAVRSGRAARLGEDFPAELRPLAAELDRLIAAREAEIARAGARAADLAHGFKTPLQALAGEAARLRAAGEGAAADGVEEIAAAMRRHVDRELARARIAARAPLAACDPSAVTGRVLAVVARTLEGSRVAWERDLPPGLAARIDADDLAEAVGALAENAARHARARVAVGAARAGGVVTVTVRDDGPGIPPGHLDRLTGRGARLDTAGPGEGLGLAIAREIAEAAGGALELANRAPGLEARLVLPAAPGPAGAAAAAGPAGGPAQPPGPETGRQA